MTLLYKLHYKTYEYNHFFKFFHHKIKKHSLKWYNLLLFTTMWHVTEHWAGSNSLNEIRRWEVNVRRKSFQREVNKSGFVFKPNSTKITDHVPAKLQTQNNFVLSRSSLGNVCKSGSACTLVHSSFPRSSLDSSKFLCAHKKFAQHNWSNWMRRLNMNARQSLISTLN